MGVLNLDALISDLDATLLELEIQSEELAPPPPPKKAAVPSQTELLAQQQAQLNLQQQLIEAQTALLKQQQQLNNTPPIPVTPLAPGVHAATANLQHNQLPGGYQPARRQPPHSLPQRSHQELPHLNFQRPQEQFNDYNKNLRTWAADSPRKVAVFTPSDSSVSHSSNGGDLYSLLSGGSSNSPGIDGGGVFGAKDRSDSDTVTSSEKKKRGWFGGSSTTKENAKDSKEAVNMVGLLEGAGF
ncbi:hypothetical protein HDU81_011338 [Chytriomyces hyalinus]|nr:hypothetical protein HDU81_011338 [Chytriomyces hyalinus]